jgi:Arc/MetJ-type ribon-helix-helix transcriptional regulator
MSEETKEFRAEEAEVEVEVVEKAKPKKSAGESVGDALSSIMETLESALTGRGNAVMVRVNDETLAKLDALVASGICKSRSESAAFLLQRGIESSEGMFSRIEEVTDQITSLRHELLDWAKGKSE